jgi:hypothetical protein
VSQYWPDFAEGDVSIKLKFSTDCDRNVDSSEGINSSVSCQLGLGRITWWRQDFMSCHLGQAPRLHSSSCAIILRNHTLRPLRSFPHISAIYLLIYFICYSYAHDDGAARQRTFQQPNCFTSLWHTKPSRNYSNAARA